MKELIIKIAPFVFKQCVYIRNIDTGEIEEVSIPQKELASFISLQENLKEVHIFGNEKFINKFQEDCLTKYNLKDCIFKINE